MAESAREDLPLTDYDGLPEGALRERVRALTSRQVEQVLAYETAHADRPAVTAMLRTRLRELERGAEPGAPTEAARPGPQGASAGSTVSPSTAAPPVNPPPHGNPAQPAQPKGNR
jgi:hypothetical protein